MIKHIIFDIGGVFIKFKGGVGVNFLTTNFGISESKAKEIWENKRQIMLIGEKTFEEVVSDLKKELSNNIPTEKLINNFKKDYSAKKNMLNIFLISLLKELEKKYQIHVLSNRIDLSDNLVETYIYPRFKRLFISHVEKMKKPNKEFYLHALKKIKSKPEEAIFIDDTEENVKAAIELGINGIIYQNMKQLKKDLRKLKIEV